MRLFSRSWINWNLTWLLALGSAHSPAVWAQYRSGKTLQYELGIAYTRILYQESGVQDLEAQGITPRLGFHLPLFSTFEAEGETWMMAQTFKSTSTVPVRYWGGNGHLGFSFPLGSPNFRLGMAGGYSYTSMLVRDQQFGFKNLHGPDAKLSLRWVGGSASFQTYGKYGWVSSAETDQDHQNREMGAGAELAFLLKGRPLGIRLDHTQSDLKFPSSGVDVKVKSRLTSVGLNFGF